MQWECLDLELVRLFVQANKFGQIEEKLTIKGLPCQFDVEQLMQLMSLEEGEQTLKALQALIKKEKVEIFDAKFKLPKKSQGWDLTKVVLLLNHWLIYINQGFFLPSRKENATLEALTIGFATWKSKQIDWGWIMYHHIKIELSSKKTCNPLSLIVATYIYRLCNPLVMDLFVQPLAQAKLEVEHKTHEIVEGVVDLTMVNEIPHSPTKVNKLKLNPMLKQNEV